MGLGYKGQSTSMGSELGAAPSPFESWVPAALSFSGPGGGPGTNCPPITPRLTPGSSMKWSDLWGNQGREASRAPRPWPHWSPMMAL